MGHTTVDCPLMKHVIDVVVFDDQERPVPDVVVELERAGQATRGRTDQKGRCRFGKLPDEDFQLRLPELDGAAWELLASLPLDPPPTDAPGAEWYTAGSKPASPVPDEHAIKEGECLAGVAVKFGFAPGTVSSILENRKLVNDRRGGRDLLVAGDQLKLPPRVPNAVSVRADRTCYVHRIGVPFALTLQRLDAIGRPLAHQRYLLELTAGSGPLPSREGATDGDGFLSELVPPDATSGQLTFKGRDQPLKVKLRFSSLPPITTAPGVTARLRHLGYRCAARDKLDDEARRALAQFQCDVGLPPTGRADGSTLRALEELHNS